MISNNRLRFLVFLLFSLIITFSSKSLIAQAGGQPIFSSTIALNGSVNIRVDIIDIVKTCNPWGFHYGFVIRVRSKSTTNSPYNITYQVRITSSTKSGHAYAGNFTLTNTNEDNIYTVFNNSFQVNCAVYGSQECNDLCENYSAIDANPTNVNINYWGTSGGNNDGSFVTPLNINLTDFKIFNQNKTNIIEWKVDKSGEKEIDYYIVNHSKDGYEWREVEQIQKSSMSVYQSIDRLYDIENYYKVQSVNYDGEIKDLKIGYIKNDKLNLSYELYDILGNEVNEYHRGLTLKRYSNGEVEKIYL